MTDVADEDRHSTVPSQPSSGWSRFELVLRAAVYVAVFAVVVAALFGVAGLRTGVVTAADGGLELRVSFAEASRPGLATPLSIEVRSTDGQPLPAEVIVELTADYREIFDENGLTPEPAAATTSGDWMRWRFEVDPDTAVFTVSFDMRLQPNAHSGRDARLRVQASGSTPLEVAFTTRVWP